MAPIKSGEPSITATQGRPVHNSGQSSDKLGGRPSMGSVGDAFENAIGESFLASRSKLHVGHFYTFRDRAWRLLGLFHVHNIIVDPPVVWGGA